jgi:presqualene diphosphate synthase
MTAQDTIAPEQKPPAQRAFGSSFYAGMRVLPRAQREAMFEIYAFCRAVDDIADGDLPRAERQRQLQVWRDDIAALYGNAPPAHLAGLGAVIRPFDLERADFLAVIDGMDMDAAADIRAPDFATLELYCDRVACAVGRLSVRIFGMERDAGRALADHLGRALQLTNILRDLDEDAEIGRLYLPREALQAAGIATADPAAVLAHSGLARACAVLVERARMHFAEAECIMAQATRRSTRAPRLMSAVYKIILGDLVARGFAPPRRRVRVSKPRLVWLLIRNMAA